MSDNHVIDHLLTRDHYHLLRFKAMDHSWHGLVFWIRSDKFVIRCQANILLETRQGSVSSNVLPAVLRRTPGRVGQYWLLGPPYGLYNYRITGFLISIGLTLIPPLFTFYYFNLSKSHLRSITQTMHFKITLFAIFFASLSAVQAAPISFVAPPETCDVQGSCQSLQVVVYSKLFLIKIGCKNALLNEGTDDCAVVAQNSQAPGSGAAGTSQCLILIAMSLTSWI